jgi:hypothetical protein
MSLRIGLLVLVGSVCVCGLNHSQAENMCAFVQWQGDCVPRGHAPLHAPTPVPSFTPPGSNESGDREFPGDTPMLIVQITVNDSTGQPTPSPVSGPTWSQTNAPTGHMPSPTPTTYPSGSSMPTHRSTTATTTTYPRYCRTKQQHADAWPECQHADT